MKNKKGFTLAELMIVVVIAAIGLFAVTTLLYSTWKDWDSSKSIKELQEDMDLVSLTVKSVLEEANWGDGFADYITEGRTSIHVKCMEDDEILWEKEFYKEGSNLILENITTGEEYIVVRTLDTIAFYESDDKYTDEDDDRHGLNNTLFVEITVTKAGRTLENQFFIRLRN